MTSKTNAQGSSTILCSLCRHIGLGHDGDHIVPGQPADQPVRGIGSVLVQPDPQAEAQALLAATPTAELLTKAYHLTHRLHVEAHAMRDNSVRAQRDLITAEVLRRTGGQ